ncbi:hypothetical protein [uncultured Winogradskyella sp.]|uniref:hypothetical protein n=1 Tax=uncultured Winogradskyella sp. TaxID=395353 RepID=UPI0030D823E8|tara:strand:+ start:3216 stop:4103 length:888 start_codon:yes stop_codon:yes gene_type:complete
MNRPYIEFRKQRDFSSILSDTFGFIRNEFKPFMKAIFNIAGPAILVFMLSLTAYNYVAGDMFNFSSFGEPSFNSGNIFVVLIAVLSYLISGVAAYILSVSSALYYIKSYVDNKGETNLAEIKKNVYKSFWSFLGMSFLKGITLIIATMLCFLPVLYAMVPMAVLFSIYVFETRSSATDAYSKSFNLVNVDFWTAFGSFIVLGIIYYLLGLIFSVPTIIYTLLSSGVFSGEIDPADISSFSADPIIIFLNVLNTFFQFLLNIILVVGGAVIYFHLHEKTTFTGTYDRISEIGKIEE